MSQIIIGLDVKPNQYTSKDPLSFKILLNDNLHFDGAITAKTHIDVVVPERESDHLLNMIMYGKTESHPTNANIMIESIVIDDYAIFSSDGTYKDVLLSQIQYTHDHNGNSPIVTEEFTNVLGCNGELRCSISTPLLFWLYDALA